ncbi:MAG: riboflavin synthase [Deltaproteobacteria bacterium]|nr:riboflavin synthase [Deltaproteobacteria bacterium]
MFTGLVQTVGEVVAASGDSPRRLTLSAAWPGEAVTLGESIAIDGCCLTVVEAKADRVSFEAATETLKRTTLGALRVGARVNVERSLRLGDLVGGHLVLGHVDGMGVVRRVRQVQSALYLTIAAPAALARLIAARGSITVAGVSLTVTSVRGAVFSVAVIPHTLAVTHLGALEPRAHVNLEADVVARYVDRLRRFP